MNIEKEELEIENRHLENTLKIINELIEEKNVNIEEYKKGIVESKKYLWQNKHEYNDPELYNTMDESDLSVNLINKDIKKVYRLYRSLENPYFSRIDFKTNDGEENTFYIGLTSVIQDYEPVVYDWRASISNLYYNYGVGKAEYPTTEGSVKGEVTLKRNFEFEMGNLLSVYDTTTSINDSILESILKHNSSEAMKNIVGTIGREQNEIIRFPNVPLVVEGVAGSGKTSVALHRIAYLLYNQKNLTYKNVLIFSPSEVFSHYISNVLPELGEENVSTTTFNDFAREFIKHVKIESLVEFIERYYEEKNHENYDEVQYKLSDDYKKDIDKYLSEYYGSLKFTKKIGLGKRLLSAAELNELKSKVPGNLKFHDKLEYLSNKLCEYFDVKEEENSSKFYSILIKLLGIEKHPLKLYEQFSGNLVNDFVPYEDVCGVLYLYFEIHGYPSQSEVKFVVIDEAQDYSKWQFEFLKSIFNSAKFTILGDTNQAINPYLKYSSLEEILDIFKGSKYKRLEYTYRSSREIIEYANGILGLENSNIIRENFGIPVKVLEEGILKETLKSCIQEFRNHGLKRIAVITKTKSETELVKSFGIDVEVLPVYVSKGLEYDGVIIYTSLDNQFSENEKNLFYVGITRALHGLVLINQKNNNCFEKR